ncbi:MAG: adenylate kinase [Candidatus Hydrothermarchaeales archaeon]
MGVIVVTGTPGAGKTTVLEGALKKRKGFEILNYGDAMFDYAKKKKIVTSRDELRKQLPETQREIQKMAARKISDNAVGASIIVDTHCTVKTLRGYLPGLPRWVLEELKPESIILVEAEAGAIVGRREKDTSRQRDEELVEAIAEHQELNRATAMAYAMFTGATVTIIKNRDGKLDEAIEEMLKVFG